MQLQSAYPVIVTAALGECRDFYVRHFGFEVIFESSWFIYLASTANPVLAVAFMTPDHPSSPPGPERFNGQGMFFTLQVSDAAAEFEKVRQSGGRFSYELRDEPWGQRRFGLIDPSGTLVDVVQQIDPAAGFWDQYMNA
ncbi:VOC family protein [Steroidobacter sp.]|uniref:VOC family protein n=1 Tax=Steroidobacter sp. TaxID=1978227 RepID=UPI001A474726|nr:VOC family protein [Steroidobacter sp.]MBL8267590.1 VOC family protein [Steroidobacter sp.]